MSSSLVGEHQQKKHLPSVGPRRVLTIERTLPLMPNNSSEERPRQPVLLERPHEINVRADLQKVSNKQKTSHSLAPPTDHRSSIKASRRQNKSAPSQNKGGISLPGRAMSKDKRQNASKITSSQVNMLAGNKSPPEHPNNQNVQLPLQPRQPMVSNSFQFQVVAPQPVQHKATKKSTHNEGGGSFGEPFEEAVNQINIHSVAGPSQVQPSRPGVSLTSQEAFAGITRLVHQRHSAKRQRNLSGRQMFSSQNNSNVGSSDDHSNNQNATQDTENSALLPAIKTNRSQYNTNATGSSQLPPIFSPPAKKKESSTQKQVARRAKGVPDLAAPTKLKKMTSEHAMTSSIKDAEPPFKNNNTQIINKTKVDLFEQQQSEKRGESWKSKQIKTPSANLSKVNQRLQSARHSNSNQYANTTNKGTQKRLKPVQQINYKNYRNTLNQNQNTYRNFRQYKAPAKGPQGYGKRLEEDPQVQGVGLASRDNPMLKTQQPIIGNSNTITPTKNMRKTFQKQQHKLKMPLTLPIQNIGNQPDEETKTQSGATEEHELNSNHAFNPSETDMVSVSFNGSSEKANKKVMPVPPSQPGVVGVRSPICDSQEKQKQIYDEMLHKKGLLRRQMIQKKQLETPVKTKKFKQVLPKAPIAAPLQSLDSKLSSPEKLAKLHKQTQELPRGEWSSDSDRSKSRSSDKLSLKDYGLKAKVTYDADTADEVQVLEEQPIPVFKKTPEKPVEMIVKQQVRELPQSHSPLQLIVQESTAKKKRKSSICENNKTQRFSSAQRMRMNDGARHVFEGRARQQSTSSHIAEDEFPHEVITEVSQGQKSSLYAKTDQDMEAEYPAGDSEDILQSMVLQDSNDKKEEDDLKTELKNVVRGDELGAGTFGRVYQGMVQKSSGEEAKQTKSRLPPQMAIKVVRAEDKKLLKKLQQECELLKTLNHPNIVKYYGYLMNDEQTEASIFMELLPHSLQSLYKNIGPLNEKIIKRHTRQVLQTLVYLHNEKRKIIHGDLKAANILFDGAQLKLTDFGESRIMNASVPNLDVSHSGVTFKEIKGSILWMAPEIIKEQPIGTRSDIWSLGCLLIELATANHPWADVKEIGQLLDKICKSEIPSIPSSLSDECQDFIRQCLQYDKDKRPSAEKLLQHRFVSLSEETLTVASP